LWCMPSVQSMSPDSPAPLRFLQLKVVLPDQSLRDCSPFLTGIICTDSYRFNPKIAFLLLLPLSSILFLTWRT
jgi:hypothetical protein